LIHQASLGFGYAEQSWVAIRDGLGLGNSAKPRQTNVAAMPVDEAYRELELEIGATASEAKVAYRQLMKKYHPDALAEQPRLLEMATELSKRIEAAYRVVLQDIANRTASPDP
jgi:DnaJ-domain-containing protein 1